MGRRYKNAPIVEAICEFRFSPDSKWDMVIPGQVYDTVKEEFPKRKQARRVGLGVAVSGATVEQQLATTDLMQFYRPDETALMQVGEHLLTINQLRPYISWLEFRPMIERALAAYRSIAEPRQLARIGLRYINQIEIPLVRLKMEDFFQFYPHLGPDLPQLHGEFIAGVEIPYEKSKDLAKLVLSTANQVSPATLTHTLDIDYRLVKPVKETLDTALQWVDTAHEHVEQLFEACLTDKLRALFDMECE